LVDPKGGATKTEIPQRRRRGGADRTRRDSGRKVLDPAGSASGAFTFANDVKAEPVDYRLFQGSVGGDNSGDWFLRPDLVVTPKPKPPEPKEPPRCRDVM